MQKILSLFVLLVFLFSCEKNSPDNTPVISSLPSNTIKKIIVDNDGIKWILTDKGIVSFFSGNSYAHPDLMDINTLKINDIVLTNNGFWVATNNGAYEIETENDKIGSITQFNKATKNIASDTVYTVGIGNNADLYFGTSQGVCIFNKNAKDTTFVGRITEEILVKHKTTAIAITKSNWVHVCTDGGGVATFKYQDSNNELDGVTSPTTYEATWAIGLKSDTVYAAIVTDDTCQWYGTAGGTGFHVSASTKRDWLYYYSRSAGDPIASDTVYSVAQDAKKTMWFGTNKGLSKFDGTNWTTYTTNDKLPGNKINTIAIDVDGSLWIGTDNGLSHYIDNKWVNFNTSLNNSF